MQRFFRDPALQQQLPKFDSPRPRAGRRLGNAPGNPGQGLGNLAASHHRNLGSRSPTLQAIARSSWLFSFGLPGVNATPGGMHQPATDVEGTTRKHTLQRPKQNCCGLFLLTLFVWRLELWRLDFPHAGRCPARELGQRDGASHHRPGLSADCWCYWASAGPRTPEADGEWLAQKLVKLPDLRGRHRRKWIARSWMSRRHPAREPVHPARQHRQAPPNHSMPRQAGARSPALRSVREPTVVHLGQPVQTDGLAR